MEEDCFPSLACPSWRGISLNYIELHDMDMEVIKGLVVSFHVLMLRRCLSLAKYRHAPRSTNYFRPPPPAPNKLRMDMLVEFNIGWDFVEAAMRTDIEGGKGHTKGSGAWARTKQPLCWAHLLPPPLPLCIPAALPCPALPCSGCSAKVPCTLYQHFLPSPPFHSHPHASPFPLRPPPSWCQKSRTPPPLLARPSPPLLHATQY